LFKDKYVTQVHVKPNVKAGDQVNLLVKALEHASMKKQNYVVYVHLNKSEGQVACPGRCKCKAGKGG
jgi:hypothetical protein